MGKHNSTLKENIVITPPKAPKSFGNWFGLFEFALKNKIYPDKDMMFYLDDENKQQYIKFTLLCQYVMQETAANFSKVTKLNEEITAENSRLSIDNEQYYLTQNILLKIYTEADKELSKIKSKWWYKLMTWLGLFFIVVLISSCCNTSMIKTKEYSDTIYIDSCINYKTNIGTDYLKKGDWKYIKGRVTCDSSIKVLRFKYKN